MVLNYDFWKKKKWSLGLEFLLRNLVQSTQYRTEHCVLCQTLSLCQVLGDVKETCSHVLKWRPLTRLPWALREARSTEVGGRTTTVFLDNMGIERSLMWQFQERNLNLTQRWAQAHLHMGKSLSWNLHWPLSLSHYHVPGRDNRNQPRTANPWEASPWSTTVPTHSANSQLKIQYSTW